MPAVPEAVLDNLRCVNCKQWLSYGPIRLLPNGGSICGRCVYVGPKDQYRHFAFEALACYFKFPCKYWENYCKELIPFKKVPEHEEKCDYGSGCSIFCSHPSVLCKSSRKLNLDAVVKLELIPDEVLEYLRCSNCAGYLSCAPVYVCRDGTSICHRCSSQIPLPSREFIRDLCFEIFVGVMIFPCIFRYRGCIQMYKFGDEMMEHEIDCPYGQTYIKEQRRSKQEPIEKNYKEKGVIKTISGHIYATLTPNAPLFSLSGMSNQNQSMFLDEFERHRDNLASKWGQTGYEEEQYLPEKRDTVSRHSPPTRHDSIYSNQLMNTQLIDELKVRQQIRDSFRQHQQPNTSYVQNQPQKMKYNVYSRNS